MEDKEKIDITPEEFDRFKKAMEKEEFRKLLCEYADEIKNPENRKKYEEEIAQMEREKGMDVKFINPTPGYVIKTTNSKNKKVFVNVCSNDNVAKPSCNKSESAKGLNWQVPHSMAPVREDKDHGGASCDVYDVVFHSDALRMTSNPRFRELLNDVSIEAIKRQFGVVLDAKKLKFPKMKFKGVPQATVVRTKSDKQPEPQATSSDGPQFPYPYDSQTSEEKAAQMRQEVEQREQRRLQREDAARRKVQPAQEVECDKAVEPQYDIVHRTEVDLQNYTNARSTQSTRPREIIVHINLPGIKSAAKVQLDVFPTRLTLSSAEHKKYNLDIALPYPVDEENGGAKFDKSRQRLSVTLPVLPEPDKAPVDTGEGASSEEVIPEQAPLVQELESTEPSESPAQGHSESLEHSSDVPAAPEFLPAVLYRLPVLDFQQTLEELAVVARAPNVRASSFHYQYNDADRAATVRFTSVGSGGFPIHFRCLMRFSVPLLWDQYSSDVTSEGLKLRIRKETWLETCDVSSDGDDWKVYVLQVPSESQAADETSAVEKPLQSSVEERSELPTVEALGTETTEPEVNGCEPAEEQAVKLTLDTDKSKQAARAGSESSIEIVQTSPRGTLHGILKRSVSESSDEPLSSSWGARGRHVSESTISEGTDDCEQSEHRRSVSFSERVDMTTYKKNESVTCLNKTLKNKRKKMRRRERSEEQASTSGGRKGRRRRCSSGGSSSGDDQLSERRKTPDKKPEPRVQEVAADPGEAGDAPVKVEEQDEQLDTDDDVKGSESQPAANEKVDDINSLHNVNHVTKCAVTFSNQVMFELDE